MSLTVGSLFSGIGGLDLGLERAGMAVRWQAEVDPYCCRVLAKHWPNVPNLGDVTKVDWEHVERVDLICGGYPCQPFSLAGVRRGRDDQRHLWPFFADAIRALRPRYALLENVTGHLSLGFADVLGDLAELGYDAEWACIPAAAVGAPHLRYRVFVVAYPERHELRLQPVAVAGGSSEAVARDDGTHRHVADADSRRLEIGAQLDGQSAQDAAYGSPRRRHAYRRGHEMADADSVGRIRRARFFGQGWRGQLANGGEWAVEPDVGRVAHGVPARVDRLRGLGNAVVPQVAEWVGRRIIAAHLAERAA